MKVIRKEREELEAYQWNGSFTKELNKMMVEYGCGIGSIFHKRLYEGKIVEGVYLIFRGYNDYYLVPEQEFKEQYEVVE